jgi:hypothetical protein
MTDNKKENDEKYNETSNTDNAEIMVDWDQVLCLKDSVEIRKEDGGCLVLDGDNDAIYAMDEMGYAILTTGQGMTFRKILDCLCKKYLGKNSDAIKEDIEQLIKKTVNLRVEE